MKASPPLWLGFFFLAIVSALLGTQLYDKLRKGQVSLWGYSPKVLRYPGARLPDSSGATRS